MTKKDSYGHNQGYTSNAEADKAAAEEKAKVYKNTHPRGHPPRRNTHETAQPRFNRTRVRCRTLEVIDRWPSPNHSRF